MMKKSEKKQKAKKEKLQKEPSLEKELADAKDKILRMLAEGENQRKRQEKERALEGPLGAARLARDLLPSLDALGRALLSMKENSMKKEALLDSFIEGVEKTQEGILQSLGRHHIRAIAPLREKFDPQFHEALYAKPSLEAAGTILEVLEEGYLFEMEYQGAKEVRLLRPARVAIAEAPPQEERKAEQSAESSKK